MCDCTGAPKASENEKDAEESAVDLMCVMFLFDFFFFFFLQFYTQVKNKLKKIHCK